MAVLLKSNVISLSTTFDFNMYASNYGRKCDTFCGGVSFISTKYRNFKTFYTKKPYRQGFQVVIYSCFTYDDGGIS